jgi:hypothetical protein
LAVCTCAQAPSFEVAFIAAYKALGFRLVNGTTGGEGAPGRKASAKERAAMSERAKRQFADPAARERIRLCAIGRKHTEEDLRKQSEKQRGKKHSPEWIAKTRAIHLGRKRSPETCAKISAALSGKKRSPEQRAKMKETAKALWSNQEFKERMISGRPPVSEQARANMRDAQLGRKHSPETRAKISASNMGKTHTPETRARLSEITKRQLAEHPERVERVRLMNLGKHLAPETRDKMSKTRKGRTCHPATRVALIESNKKRAGTRKKVKS